MKGRKPYPYVIMEDNNDKNRLTKGTLAKRKEHEPTIRSNYLKCPSHLSSEAKKEWNRLVELYGELDKPILYDLDANALEIYCDNLVTYRKAMKKVRETAEVYTYKNDLKPRKNPWLTIANDAAIQIKKYGEMLLLDPVSRARVGIAKANTEEELTGMALFLYQHAQAKREGNE